MALCASCGSVSAPGAMACAACGELFAATELVFLDEVAAPPLRPAGGRNRFVDADWRPALKAVVAPTGLLLLAAYGLTFLDHQVFGSRPPFAARYGAALSLVLAAFGAPWRLTEGEDAQFASYAVDHTIHLLPMTLTVLWAGLLLIGLRRARARKPLADRVEAYAEAARTALVAGAVTLLIGLLAGADWLVPDSTPLSQQDGGASTGGAAIRMTADSGWLWAVAGTVVLAGAVALAVHGAGVLREAAGSSATLRGWLKAGQVAGQALLITVGLLSVVGFVLVACTGSGSLTAAALAVLPNLGLLLLGFGSGGTLTAANRYHGHQVDQLPGGELRQASLLDLGGLGGEYRVALLAALLGAVVLALGAHRRGLDRTDRLRLAVVYAVALSALTAASGVLVTTDWRTGTASAPGGDLSAGTSLDGSVAFGWSGPVVIVLWTALGALLLPALLARAGWGGPVSAEVARQQEVAPESVPALLPPSTEVLESGY